MGQTLSYPGTTKRSETGEDSKYLFAVVDMQGWRIAMEDAHATVLQLEEGQDKTNAFFAVYDGHGGSTIAKYAGANLHKRLVTEEAYKQEDFGAALKCAFLGIDQDIVSNPTYTREPSGCTAVAALISHDNKIYVANAGDSRAVISVKGQVEPLSYDHKPSNDTEKARITAAGGYIEYGRVNGNLALSRALGDFEFKKNTSLGPEKQIITADPDITCHEIGEEDEFMIIACDGIWDCLSSQQAVDFVRHQVSEGKDLKEIGENICEHCLAPDTTSGAGIGCDNMTVLIVAILHGRTKEEWYAWIRDRVEKKYGHDTPSEPPYLYSPVRLRQFRARREIMEARGLDKNPEPPKSDDENNPLAAFLGSAGLGSFARMVSNAGGGISFSPDTGLMSGNTRLMFGNDDSDDDDDDSLDGEREEENGSIFQEFQVQGAEDDSTSRLKSKLAEYEKDEDGDTAMVDATTPESALPNRVDLDSTPPDAINGEAPPPPQPQNQPLVNGETKTPITQFKSKPLGDATEPVVKAEGLNDKSEDPIQTSAVAA